MNKVLEHKEFMESQKYQQELKHFTKLVKEFVNIIRTCSLYSTRAFEYSKNSLLLTHTDEIIESAVSYLILIDAGVINPIIRELRYILETSLKYLVVDQKCSDKSYTDKIEYLNNNIPRSSIDCIEDVDIICLDNSDKKKFYGEVKDIYKKICKFIHPSKEQIRVYDDRVKRGAYLGFETEKELKKINSLAYKVFEYIIVLHLTSLGVGLAGDMFIYYFDEEKNCKFNKCNYIKKISEFYNYKYERKSKHI